MAARDALALLVRCNDLLFAVPIDDVDRIVSVEDVRVQRAGELVTVTVAGEEPCPGWDLGALLGRMAEKRATWLLVHPELQSKRRRYALACDRSIAVRPITGVTRLPPTLFKARPGAIDGVFRSPLTEGAPNGFRLDAQRLLGPAELAAVASSKVAW